MKEKKRKQAADASPPRDEGERKGRKEMKPKKEKAAPALPSQIKNRRSAAKCTPSLSARRRPRSASSPARAARSPSAPPSSASSRQRGRCHGRSRTPGRLTRPCAGLTTRSCLQGMMLMSSMQF